MTDPEEAISHPVTAELDLHTFRPSEIGELLPEYFAECQRLGFRRVRIIHGKGTGTLRKGVHDLLAKITSVESFKLADESSGGWGATWVNLVEAGHKKTPPDL